MPTADKINPSAENIAKYIYDEIDSGLGTREGVRVAMVKLWETDTASAIYRLSLPSDIEFSEGNFKVAGTDKSVTLKQVAMAAFNPTSSEHCPKPPK